MPDGPGMEPTGYDADGNSIVRATTQVVKPGEFFTEANPVEARWFIDNDAAREPTPRELETYERFGDQVKL